MEDQVPANAASRTAILPAALLFAAMLVCGCDRQADSAKPAARPGTLITVAQALQKDVEVIEETIGSVESPINPTVTAEVSGRVTQVLARAGASIRKGQLLAVIDPDDLKLSRDAARAEAGRIEALLSNQNKVVERNRQLVGEGFISKNVLDEAVAQQKALEEQLSAARSQLSMVRSNITKTRVLSPLDAQVERPIVSEGDYVSIGTPMFDIVSTRVLNVYLPFPETVAPRLRVGLPVRISSPATAGEPIEARIAEIKTMVGTSNRAVQAIVRLQNQPGWKPGSSVTGRVVLETRPGGIVVPEQSVVLRPAGKVVYVIDNGKAVQRIVTTGFKSGDMIEILSGLQAGETVALDGAGFLSDGAAVNVQAASS
jgi:membrane fusion protein, multidrug efflux system